MPVPGIRLGVDFGTSNTVAVLRWADGRARPLIFDGSPLLPSAVYAEPAGGLVVGRDAVHSARLDPARFDPNPKRRIDEGVVLLGNREVPVVELVAAALSRVNDEFRRTVGDAPADTTLTCPASWGATRRLVLADGAAAAGLGQVRIVPEPVAAATYFTQVLGRDVPIGSVVVVYDFGAGTFDASVVARNSSGFEVLAVDGCDDVGGLDIDAAMVELIGKVCTERDAATWRRMTNPSSVEERRARRLLWDDARAAKERLSRHPTADITVPLLNVDVHVTRQELEERARPLLEQTVRLTQGVMRWANLAEGRCAGVFLVGGASRIPLVATMLHRALGEAPVAIEQPELVVAEGSVLAGAAAVGPGAGPGPGPGPASRPTSGAPASGPPAPVSVPPAAGVSPAAVSPATGVSPAAVSPARITVAPTRHLPRTGEPVQAGPSPRYQRGSAAVRPPEPALRARAAAAPVPRVYPAASPPYPAAARSSPARPARVAPASSAARPAAVPTARPAAVPTARRRGRFGRAVRKLLLVLLLIAVPLIAAYVSFTFGDGSPF